MQSSITLLTSVSIRPVVGLARQRVKTVSEDLMFLTLFSPVCFHKLLTIYENVWGALRWEAQEAVISNLKGRVLCCLPTPFQSVSVSHREQQKAASCVIRQLVCVSARRTLRANSVINARWVGTLPVKQKWFTASNQMLWEVKIPTNTVV